MISHRDLNDGRGRPQVHLLHADTVYPRAVELAADFYENRGVKFPNWPSWCFMPLAAWYAVVSEKIDCQAITDPVMLGDVYRLGAIGAWRYTQGIYRINQDLFAALLEAKVEDDIPVAGLLRLPEWSVYIETSGVVWKGFQLHGFWAHLECNNAEDRDELRFVLDAEEGLVPLAIHLGPWSVEEGVVQAEHARAERLKRASNIGLLRDAREDVQLAQDLQPLLSLVLYLCSDGAEIDGPEGATLLMPSRQAISSNDLQVPAEPTIWHVGKRVGPMVKSAQQSGHGFEWLDSWVEEDGGELQIGLELVSK